MPDAPALHIDKLQFRYSHGDPLVIDIDALELAPGEQVLLTGTSGRGKSTLLYLIAGLMEPTSGTVRVAGQDIHALAGHKRDQFRGSSIGMIFQTFNLLPGFSATENVMLAMMFSEIPDAYIRKNVVITEIGIATPMIEVVFQLRRKKYSTRMARIPP